MWPVLPAGKGTYHEAEAVGIDPVARTLACRYNKPSRRGPEDHVFELPYDVLVVAVGAIQNDFHTPGVKEHAYFLKVRHPREHAGAVRFLEAVLPSSR